MIFTVSAVIRLETGRMPGILPRKRFCILSGMWNSTIARNVCVDYFRKCQRRNQQETDLSSDIDLVGGEALSFCTRQEEVIVSVEELSRQLPAMQREAVILYYGYGYKYREIAHMTGVGIATVKSRVHQGTEKLRRMAKKEELCEE